MNAVLLFGSILWLVIPAVLWNDYFDDHSSLTGFLMALACVIGTICSLLGLLRIHESALAIKLWFGAWLALNAISLLFFALIAIKMLRDGWNLRLKKKPDPETPARMHIIRPKSDLL